MALKSSAQQALPAGTDLINLINQARSNQRTLALLAGPTQVLVIDGTDNVFYDPDGVVLELVDLVRAGSCQLLELSEIRKKQWLLDREPSVRPLEDLLWVIGYIGYDPEDCCFDKGCRAEDVIQLKRWPNLTRLPRSSNSIRLASLFSMRPTSVYLAGRILKVELEEVKRFYNAACSSGLAVRTNGEPIEWKARPHRRQKLISSLFSYLGNRHRQQA